MKITSLSTAGTHVRPDGVAMTEFFSAAEGAKVTMGHAVFPAGTVVPGLRTTRTSTPSSSAAA